MATLGRRSSRIQELLAVAGVLVVLAVGLHALTDRGGASRPPAAGVIHRLASPILGAGEGVHRRAEAAWLAVFASQDQEARIADLEQRLAEAQLAIASERSRIALDSLALDVSTHMPAGTMELTAASVVAWPVPGGRQVVWIGAGHDRALRPGMVVMGPGGIVGQVAEVYDRRSLVLLVTDPQARWSAEVELRGELGFLRGTGEDGVAEFHFGRTTIVAEVGDMVVSTGMVDSLAPGGVPFGRVREITRTKNGEPVAVVDLLPPPGRLRTVFVLPVVKTLPGAAE